jgi:hypothetical protein
MQALLALRRRQPRFAWIFITYSSFQLVLVTISSAAVLVFGEMMWIVNADFPGGSSAYLMTYANVWYQTWGTTAFIAFNLLADASMVSITSSEADVLCSLLTPKIWRCVVIWSGWRVGILPAILWLATFGE